MTEEGLLDMAGNVFEWVEDCYNQDYTNAPNNGSARTSNCSESSSRVLRGGCWFSYRVGLRAALRFWFDVGNRRSNVGFRVVRVPPSRHTRGEQRDPAVYKPPSASSLP